MNEECQRCVDQERCVVWFIKMRLQWVSDVYLKDGTLFVEHEYPEHIDVANALRTLFRERRLGMPLELHLIRVAPGSGGRPCAL